MSVCEEVFKVCHSVGGAKETRGKRRCVWCDAGCCEDGLRRRVGKVLFVTNVWSGTNGISISFGASEDSTWRQYSSVRMARLVAIADATVLVLSKWWRPDGFNSSFLHFSSGFRSTFF